MLTRHLPVDLTKDELRFRGLELGKLRAEVADFEAKKKRSTMKSKTKSEVATRRWMI